MVTEVIHRSWGSRLLDSIKSIVFGVVLFGFGLGLLWWNEGRAVDDYRLLSEVKTNIKSVSSDSVSSQNDGKVVHVIGSATTSDQLTDPFFDVSANVIHLRRDVEMYQWRQNQKSTSQKKMGGSEDTVVEYSYEKVWSNRVINSSDFREPEGHQNPSSMQPERWNAIADKVILGSFTLSSEVIQEMNFYESYSFNQAKLPEDARLEDSVIKIGSTGAIPDIGDRRITFQVVPQGTVSIIAAQKGADLKPWRTQKGKSYLRVQSGTHTAEEMLAQAEAEVRFLTWILRAGGWALLTCGMVTVLKPIAVIGDVIPFIGNLIGGGIFIFSLLTTAVISLFTIAIAWITVRPLVGIPLLLVAVALILYLWRRGYSKRSSLSERGNLRHGV